MWCGDGSLKASEKIRYSAKQQSKSGCFFRGVVDWIRRREGICLNWRKAERYETYLSETSLWCLYESERLFLQSCCWWSFSFERLKLSMLLILFSFFEVKIPPPILLEVFVLIFANQFHLCQLMFQSLLFGFHQIKSQKQNGSSESLIGGNLRTSW